MTATKHAAIKCCKDYEFLHSSLTSGNCSNCGQFLSMKDDMTIRTIREKGIRYKLEIPVSMMLKRMNKVS